MRYLLQFSNDKTITDYQSRNVKTNFYIRSYSSTDFGYLWGSSSCCFSIYTVLLYVAHSEMPQFPPPQH